MTAASVAAVVALALSSPVRASNGPTPDLAQDTVGNKPNDPAQNTSPPGQKGTTTAKVNVDDQGIILNGYDAVAYFRQGKPVKGNSANESTYQGATYLFASSADKVDFDKNPAKYAPRYGAFCSFGVANGVLTDIGGPDAFIVYKGKLYLCGDEGALKEFKSDIDSNIEKADKNWLNLVGP
jgi:YHS domain-containing protein